LMGVKEVPEMTSGNARMQETFDFQKE
jgi:hypothetical protein